MESSLSNLGTGIYKRFKKMFYRPYSVFNIGWVKEKFLKHQVNNNALKYHLYKNKYKVAFRDAPTFLVSINELFINEFYKFRTPKTNPVIIDCGSYIGTSILYFKVNYPGAKVIGFEPDEKNYSLLKLNLDNWGFSDTSAVNEAIWITNGYISFNESGDMSSKIAGNTINTSNTKMVKCVRLKDMLNEEIDFLKIDIEGSELPVLKDCSDKLKNVKNLFVEYHGTYNETYKLNELLEILIQNNFDYYIKECVSVYPRPLWDRTKLGEYDMLLNIFAFQKQ